MRAAIVVAGGVGERFGHAGGKQLALVAGLPVVTHALRAFDDTAGIDCVVLVCHPQRIEEFSLQAVNGPGIRKVIAVVGGGRTRHGSVAAGLASLPQDAAVVAIHDGARPLIEPSVIAGAIAELDARPDLDGVVVGHPAFDTIKSVEPDGTVTSTPERSGLWVAQTPQVFRTESLLSAHSRALAEGWTVTDDASLVERDGGRVRMIEGPRWNIKVTLPEDLAVVEALLAARGKV